MADTKVLSFTGDGLIVVQSRITGTPQQALIRDAASIGQLAGELNSTFTVRANPNQAWTLKVQHQLANGQWEDSPIRLGAKSVANGIPVQLVECERETPSTPTSDFADLVLRVERAQAVAQPDPGPGPGPGPQPGTGPGVAFIGNARVVVHANGALLPQQLEISAAAHGNGNFVAALGASVAVAANGVTPWTLLLREKKAGATTFTTRPLVLGARTQRNDVQTQFVASENGDVAIRVEQQIPQVAPADGYLVRGRVTWANGDAYAGKVSVYDLDLRHEQLIGTATTDVSGEYELKYTLASFSRGELKTADLVIRAVVTENGAEKVLGESPISFNAGPVAVIDLVLMGAPNTALSEYETIEQRIVPALDGAKASELSDDRDVKFLAGETGEPVDRVWFFVLASRFAATLPAVPPMAFYGLLREGAGLDLPTLLENSPEREKELLLKAASESVISLERLGATVDAIVLALQAGRQGQGTSKIKSLLTGVMAIPDAALGKLVDVELSHAGSPAELWDKVAALPEFSAPGKVADLQFAVQAFALTDGNLPLARMIQQKRPAGAADARALTDLSIGDWEALIRQSIEQGASLPTGLAGEDDDQRITSYARGLALTVEGAFVTPVLGKKITQGVMVDVALAKRILTDNPSLDLKLPPPIGLHLPTDEDERQRALETLATLRGEALTFPGVNLRDVVMNTPTPPAAAAALTTISSPARQAMAKIFTDRPNFDLTDHRAIDLLATDGDALLGSLSAQDRRAVEDTFRASQRLYNVVPKADYVTYLLGRGLSSATRIARVSESRFVLEHGPSLGGEAVAKVIHRAARRQAAGAATLFALVNRAVNEVGPAALGGKPDTASIVEQLPNWASLFGQLELADCAECRSVHGAAAYFVDLLNMLDEAPVPDGRTAPMASLDLRRPDLLDLELTCENTHTEISHADLTNEVARAFIARLRAAAGLPSVGAEALLAAAVYPFSLPLDLPLESERRTLAAFGTSRAELLAAYRPTSDQDRRNAALEWLGSTPALTQILVEDTGVPVDVFYGLDPTDSAPSRVRLSDLSKPRVFLERTGLSFIELLELLNVRSLVDGNERLGLTSAASGDPADLDGRTVTGVSSSALLMRVHRFLRLWRALRRRVPELGLRELDAALVVLDETDPNAEIRRRRLLESLAFEEQARSILGLDLLNALTLWGPMDTVRFERVDENGVRVSAPSFYEAVFRDPRLLDDPDFALNDDGSLAGAARRLTDKKPSLQAVLRVTEAELDAILRDAQLTSETLSVANISTLYRYAILGRALRASVDAIISARRLFGVDPFASPETMLDFLGLWELVKSAKFRISELDYLLAHRDELDETVAPAPDTISALRQSLISRLEKVDTDTDPNTPDPNGERLRGLLEDLFGKGTAELARAISIVDGASSDSEADRLAFIAEQFAFLPEALRTLLADNLSGATSDARARERKDRRRQVFAGIQLLQREKQRRDAILETLAAPLSLPTTLVRTLLTGVDGALLLLSVADPAQSMLSDFQDPANADRFARAYTRLYKVALLNTRLSLDEREIVFFQGHGVHFGGFDLNALPVAPVTAAVLPFGFAAWQALARFAALEAALPAPLAGGPRLLDLFETTVRPSASVAEAVAALARVSGWSNEDTWALALARGLSGNVAAFRDSAELDTIRRALELSRRIGVSAAKLSEWAVDDVDAAQAKDVREALKAKFDPIAWERVSVPIDDELRDLLREGLVRYILTLKDQANVRGALADAGALGLRTSAELFEYLLIDVEMTAVMRTSRLVQATAAVQMFVQRILLNLEPTISPMSIEADRWKWMKQFRVWEANRKVFLYPENYIEPELRDDKTPFFRELETDLKQSDVTPATVEAAYLSYLRKLDDVAHIEIAGHCHDIQTDVHHVFAKTHDDPPVYYYRRFQENAWTGWERVPLEIESAHVAPVVYRRRLYLFWAIFKEKAADPDASQLDAAEGRPSGGRQPRRRWEVSLGFSEYQNGKWSPKRIASGEKGSARHPVSTGSLSLLEQGKVWEGSPAPTAQAATGNDLAMFFSNFLVPINENPPPSRFTSELDLYRLNVGPYHQGPQLFVNLELMAAGGSGSGSGRTAHFLHLGYWNLVRTGLSLSARAAYNQGWVDVRPSGWGGGGMSWRLPGDFRLMMPIGLLSSDAQRNVPGMEEALILENAPNGTVLFSPQDWVPVFAPPFPAFFYQDGERTYFVSKRDTTQRRWQTDQYLYPRALEVLKYSRELPLSTLRLGRADPGFATSFPSYSGSGATVGLPRLAFGGYWREVQVTRVHFAAHYHSHTSSLIETLNALGIDAMLSRVNQAVDDGGGVFRDVYEPTALVHSDYPRENFDFRPDGAYSIYNWELFFHIPMLLASRLSREQRFEEAQRFYHYVFNPTNNDPGSDLSPQRVWRFRPFQLQTEGGRIQDLLLALADPNGDPAIKKALRDQIAQWTTHPFEPHRIARLRLSAYERNVFFKYIDNLLAWGDQLFARDTRESINEATQLYVLVSRLLGPRQERIPDSPPPALTYRQLRPRIDDFGNALIAVEDQIATNALGSGDLAWLESLDSDGAAVVGFAETLYFCIPQNRKLLGYWDTVEDRLFKIRHGLNLQGVARSLSLFAPEIDPGALVRAAAAGVDIGQVVSNLETPLGFYRFDFLLPKALQLCDEVRSFGAALLAALEKRDAEALGNLRARHDAGFLELVRRVRERQIEEARITLRGLERSQELLEFRRNYFANLQRINPREQEHLAALDAADDLQAAAQASEALSAILYALPTFNIGFAGFGGSPTVTGTISVGAVSHAAAQVLGYLAGRKTYEANRAALLGSWDRRQEDWTYQANLASKELAQVEQQIEAARVRIGITERELENHDRQIENARAVEAFLRDKFTNEELYGWMVSEVSGLYFQAYQLAYQLAKQVERTFRFERGLRDSNFVAFGAWDSLRKGLLSGERLSMDLRRLEMAYLQQNAREYELTKNISLLLHDPAALITLMETGQCEFHLPEELFDLDHPGHYMRRVKSVSVTVPCVTGPYSGVHGTLTLISSRIRGTDQLFAGSSPYREQAPSDPRFVIDFSATQSIATSTGQNDAGLFEVSMHDDRYLPFEGAGVISDWRLELPKATNGFDFDTITDVIVRVQYVAREGGEALRNAALAAAVLPPASGIAPTQSEPLTEPNQAGQARLFSARHEFPDAWHAFVHPATNALGQRLVLELSQDRFPLRYRGQRLALTRVSVLFKWADAVAKGSGNPPVYTSGSLSGQVTPPAASAGPALTFNSLPTVLAGTAFAEAAVNGGVGAWTVGFTDAQITALAAPLRTPDGTTPARLNPDLVEDVIVIAQYDVTS